MTDSTKILVIDDSEDDRLLYCRTLKKCTQAHYILSETDNGEDGIIRIQKEEPACILLDYSLPGHDGIEILKRIRIIAPFTPIVMLTGQGNEKVAVAAMQEGAQNYISKASITPETLNHTIRMAIDRCAMQRRIAEQRVTLEVFTRALAHDLKEPLRTISAFSKLITEEESLSETGIGYFQHIQNSANRMHMLVDSVFIYTQLGDSTYTTLETCNAFRILEETKEQLRDIIKENQVVITNSFLPDIQVNHVHLGHIFWNIISNSIRHSHGSVTINIQAEEQEKHWLFSIQDNGPGISSEHFTKIFEPFKRLAHDEKGAGLGLAICKKIIDSYGGKIWCESQFGKGTTFFFTLPKSLEPKQALPPVQIAPPVATVFSPGHKKTLANVLLVDDRKADLELTRVMLFEYPGLQCNLHLAYGAKEAIDMMCDPSNPVDLILLDINMPDMDGFELLELMRKEDSLRQIPVIMYTGSTYEEDRKKAESLGALGYLVKPAEFDTLKPMIEKASNVYLSKEGNGYRLLRNSND